ncbi:esterase-like activity of phytase family protein [Ramlibacter monticola]|uniref:Esterase-like activity of phytase family protein n=1 Tax=Ramlibacter monticola TaxID=1926872 RepID=A0A936YZI4_9BURK|nr:esterase-like activity of phytase family protein [Ramlibacter monticola]MBL0392109.1 esterase-like activity of phytase family protein [Ramlibacter monticola]
MPLPSVPTLSRRTLLRGAAAACALAATGCATRAPSPPPQGLSQLRLLGEKILPHGLQVAGTTVGGLSGIDHDPATGLWVAMCDDRSELQPARFYTLRVDLRPAGLDVEVLDAITLRQATGTPFPKRQLGGEVVDPESIRLLPGRRGILWTSEGDYPANQSPTLRESRLDGSLVRNFEVPAMLQFGRPGSGPRANLTFEGLALSPDARTAWVGMEAALHQDGPEPAVGRPGGPCRFTAFDVASGRAVRQVAYIPDPIPQAPALPGGGDNGVSEILMIDADRMLVLERAYMAGVGMSLRIYEIDTREGSDTLAMPRLQEGAYRACGKRFVADLSQLGLSRLDNTEGMCWGPRLPGGRRSLVVVSDDNFSSKQVTQFAAFEYLGQE